MGLITGVKVLVTAGDFPESRAMDHFFAELGRTVLARWKDRNFSLAAFPEIARHALDERPPSQHVDLPALVEQFLLNDEQPFQTSSGFGQPELVVYDDPRFYIQILFWLDGTTDIHQHEFSGAFHVMEGSSIHSEFTFENSKSVSAHFRVGDLQMTHTQLLETGSTVAIISGRKHIHSLFHLETPSISVVIRTHSDPGTGPQFTYLPPHIALDPVYHDGLTTRRKQLLDVLEQTGDPTYADLVLEMIGQLDFERGFFILQNGLGYLQNLGRWDEALGAFQEKHGALADGIAATLEEIVRRDALAGLRSSVTEVDHRFFLALLLNVPDRKAILNLVAQRFPENAVDTIMRWAEELSDISPGGVWIVDVEFPAEVKIPKAQRAKIFLAALRSFLEGKKPKLIPGADLKSLRAAFTRSSLRALVS